MMYQLLRLFPDAITQKMFRTLATECSCRLGDTGQILITSEAYTTTIDINVTKHFLKFEVNPLEL